MSNFFTKLASTVGIATIVVAGTSASLVSAASEFLPYAEALATNSVIGTQSSESGYRLGANITRAELAKVVANLGDITATECTGTVFSDVGTSLGDLCGSIEGLADAGVVSTSAATFRPNANVTRAEMTKMILGALGETPSDVDAGYMDVASLGDLAGYINRANEIGCASSASYFRPNATASRGEAFKIAACVAQLDVETTTPTTPTVPPTTSTGVTSTSGSVSVSLDGTAAALYVPMNASSVNVGKFKITATNGDVTVSSVTIGRSGLGNSQNVNLSLSQNGVRISENRTINTSTQEGIVRLNTPLTIKKGESVTLSLLVSVSAQANAQHQFAVNAVNSAMVTPVTLGLINTTSYSVATTTVDTVTLRSVSAGRNDQNFATVTLRAGNQDTTVNGFTLTKTSGVDLTRAFANVSVFKNGVKVGAATVTSDKIYVTGLTTDLTRNNNAVYDLRADVIYVGDGSNTDDIVMNITETEDVSAVEKSTGYSTESKLFILGVGVKVDLSDLDIILTKKVTPSLTVSPGASSVTLLDGTINSSASFDISSFTLTSNVGTTGSGVFSALTLTVNGVDYDLIDTNGAVKASYVFDKSGDKFRVDNGAPVNVLLRGTLLNNATQGQLRYTLGLTMAKNITTGNTVALSGKELNGDAITVNAPTLKIRQATVSAPTSTKIFSNATDLEIGRFGVEAKADEVSVSKITITNVASSSGITDLRRLISGSSAKLVGVDGSIIASSATVNAGSIEFRSVNLRVAKDTTANVRLVVTTLSDLSSITSIAALGGTKFLASVTIQNSDLSSANSAAPTMTPGITVTPDVNKVYSVSTQPPVVKVTSRTLVDNSAVATVTVTNIDPDLDLTLSGAKIRVSFRSTANGTAPTIAGVCLRNVGSNAACNSGLSGVLTGTESPTGTFTYVIDASSLSAASSITKNNGTTDFEVFIPNAPVWVAGDNVSVSLEELNYVPQGLGQTSESYIGIANASVVSVK